jgi:hypothetical protein
MPRFRRIAFPRPELPLFALAAILVVACGGQTSGGSAEDPCRKGDTKEANDGCNTCTCQADGTWGCTLMACIDSGVCHVGDTKKFDCNTCTCRAEGDWACTAMACDAGPFDTGISDTTPDAKPDAPPRDPRCPATWAEAQGAHDDLCASFVSCTYDEGSCYCPPYCGGPAPGPDWKPSWACTPKPTPRTDGCPDSEPVSGKACAPEGKTCTYGSCCFSNYECVSGKWKGSGPICPP